jgi:hypothetical protein
MEGVIGDGKGKGGGWNETREGEKGNRNGDGEESMNYPYIISSLFVPVWVVSS